MSKFLMFLPLFFVVLVLAIDIFAFAVGWRDAPLIPRKVTVISGPHKGRSGNVVSIPWLGNGYNARASINVPSQDGRREWISVWYWEIQ